MKRTSMFFDEKLLEAIERLAKRRGTSVAAVVREAAEAYVATAPAQRLPSIAGKYASGETDVAERMDELLWRDPHE